MVHTKYDKFESICRGVKTLGDVLAVMDILRVETFTVFQHQLIIQLLEYECQRVTGNKTTISLMHNKITLESKGVFVEKLNSNPEL